MTILTNTGLVLEGGGMRGIYTAGVIDCLLQNKIDIPYIIGVSAGACMGFSYVSKQLGRDRDIILTHVNDPRYFGYRNLLKEGNIFSRKFLYDEIPHKLFPYDYKTYQESSLKLIVVATNCKTGEPEYFDSHSNDPLIVLAASASLPFASRMVKYKDKLFLDGGISDSIPIKKSISAGNTKNIVVLTQPAGYRKHPGKSARLIRWFYFKYPKLAEVIINRYQMYNETLDFIETQESENKALVIRPSKDLKVERIEKNVVKLRALYDLGFKDTEDLIGRIASF